METRVMTLTDFLLARIAEDEAAAHDTRWLALEYGVDSYGQETFAARILAECEAKRRIVELHEFERGRRDAYRSPRARAVEDDKAAQDRRTQEARSRVAEDVLRLLALPYADHPEYDESWKP